MVSWAPDKKERGVVINKVPKGNIYLKTADCVEICKELTSNKESLDAAAAMKGSSSTDDLTAAAAGAPEPAPRAEEGVPPVDGTPLTEPEQEPESEPEPVPVPETEQQQWDPDCPRCAEMEAVCGICLNARSSQSDAAASGSGGE